MAMLRGRGQAASRSLVPVHDIQGRLLEWEVDGGLLEQGKRHEDVITCRVGPRARKLDREGEMTWRRDADQCSLSCSVEVALSRPLMCDGTLIGGGRLKQVVAAHRSASSVDS